MEELMTAVVGVAVDEAFAYFATGDDARLRGYAAHMCELPEPLQEVGEHAFRETFGRLARLN